MIIYEIKNKKNDKRYIGRSNSKHRWYQHLSGLRLNRHHSYHLQYAWNKYGEDNFEFNVIDNADSIEELVELEIFYTLKYKSWDRDFGYNINIGGVHYDVSEATRQKLRNRPAKSRNDLSKRFRKTPFPKLIGPDGIVYEIEPSLRYFCKLRGLTTSCMGNLIHGRLNYYKGWTVDGKGTDIEQVKRKRADDISRARIGGREALFISPVGTEFLVTNVSRFSKENKLDSSIVNKIIRGQKKTTKGWTLKSVTYNNNMEKQDG